VTVRVRKLIDDHEDTSDDRKGIALIPYLVLENRRLDIIWYNRCYHIDEINMK